LPATFIDLRRVIANQRESTVWRRLGVLAVASEIAGLYSNNQAWTRRELLTLFREDGGLQFVKTERYVYKECPIIKVDVTFTITDMGDHSNDRITSIS
jgi:hypothetical protein